jgi:hypothetical protein
MAYLVRSRPYYEWTDGDGTVEPYAQVEALGPGFAPYHIVRPRLTVAEFAEVVTILYPTAAATPSAPVWPGFAEVTLGDPVALVDQLIVEGPMHGLLIAVTTPPQRLGSYRLGTETLDYGVGRITFETDSGDMEPWQYLGFRTAIYTPKSMAIAERARLQVLGGAEGTATPWTRS